MHVLVLTMASVYLVASCHRAEKDEGKTGISSAGRASDVAVEARLAEKNESRLGSTASQDGCPSVETKPVCVSTKDKKLAIRADKCHLEDGDRVVDQSVCASMSCTAASCMPTACKDGSYFANCNASCSTISYFQEPCKSVGSSPVGNH